eukprot:365084-Chlamydomonas_euryale.AAC.31
MEVCCTLALVCRAGAARLDGLKQQQDVEEFCLVWGLGCGGGGPGLGRSSASGWAHAAARRRGVPPSVDTSGALTAVRHALFFLRTWTDRCTCGLHASAWCEPLGVDMNGCMNMFGTRAPLGVDVVDVARVAA